jgi:hypothetical protein
VRSHLFVLVPKDEIVDKRCAAVGSLENSQYET